jgi:hypothetical protein
MSTTAEDFDLPDSLESAEIRRKQLTLDVQSIQAQLGDKQRTDEDGNRLSSKEYWAWKKRAQHALNQKLDELRAVKHWIREKKRSLVTPIEDVSGTVTVEEAVGHLRQLHRMLTKLQEEGVEFSADEFTQIDAAGHVLRRSAYPQAQGNQA